MGIGSFWHILVVILLAILLFGRGKISELMGDVAKGIRSFKRGMADEDQAPKALTAEQPAGAERSKAEEPAKN